MRVNEHFASELHKFIRPDDVVWVHDYHLMPLAKMLRERGHRNRIGFFLHIPFPPTEMLTALPNHERLIGTMVHYDLVGFQTDERCRQFRALSRARMSGDQDRSAHVRRRGSPRARRGLPDQHRNGGIQSVGAARRALAVREERAGKPFRPYHDDRRRSARLLEGSAATNGGIRAFPASPSGLGRARHLSADHAQEPLGDRRVHGDGAPARFRRGAHQRHLRRGVVDADSLRESDLQPDRAGRPLPRRRAWRW